MADVLVPDMGSDDPVDIAEILVKVGDTVAVEDSLLVLESAKASVEVPSPAAGQIKKIHVKAGQSLHTGDLLMTIADAGEGEDSASEQSPKEASETSKPKSDQSNQPKESAAKTTESSENLDTLGQDSDQDFKLPDIGGETAEVIELSIQPGAEVKKDQTLLVLESAKATIEVPAEVDGVLVKYLVKIGDSVNEGAPFVTITTAGKSKSDKATANAQQQAAPSQESSKKTQKASTQPPQSESEQKSKQSSAQSADQTSQSENGKTSANDSLEVNLSADVHAGPAVRRLANTLGVVLSKVSPSGPRGRILKEDVQKHVKTQMLKPKSESSVGAGTLAAQLPTLDFSQYGEIEEVTMTKIQQMSAQNLHRAWVTIPHVTQFDEADITDLENFRKSLGDEYKAQGIKVTMLAFMIKASVLALKKFPRFNASLHPDGKTLIQKNYYHIGFAADTPFGLVVPVIRNADQLSVVEIAQQLGELSGKARDKKLSPKDMQGGCFSISSLGGIGGTAFTPIVNWPEVAILGVSRASMQPRWQGKAFEPRLILPLSLSYDHRVIDGADAARFGQYLVTLLSDSRRMLL